MEMPLLSVSAQCLVQTARILLLFTWCEHPSARQRTFVQYNMLLERRSQCLWSMRTNNHSSPVNSST
jgi:hypothetical protein